jgi:M6 family metalloprotease-like protein
MVRLARQRRLLAIIGVLCGAVCFATLQSAEQQAPTWPSRPIDPQNVRDQENMTWEDYTPIPGATWNDPDRQASVRTIKLAIVCADFPDQPFVMTLPSHSDLYGNPQVDPVAREQVPRFYLDFWTKPQAVNHGHTVHEYWMEQSRGRIGVSARVFGPYRMPGRSFQYGLGGGMNGQPAQSMPAGYEPNPNQTRDLDALWTADAGADIRSQFDLVVRLYAGYDESAVWQEFGEMKFQTKDDIPAEWGNPDPAKPRWVKTRYIDWTSWNAARWLWSNSSIITGEGSGAIRHEVSHAAFKIGDNYNNPYVQPYRRAASGPWDLMDRGSFNGPGGPHERYLIPKTEGDAMSAGLMLRQRINFGFVTPEQVLIVPRSALAQSGLIVADVTARESDPLPSTFAGIVVRLDGDAPQDRTPPDDPVANPLSSGTPNYDFYSLEVVQRMGYDSFTPDSGVLLAKNKDKASTTGGPNGFSVFNWVIDAHPEDVSKIDFKRPDGTPVMRTVADYRQLNDALFHAGSGSGSQFEWTDQANKLQFYVVDVHHDARGVLSYTLAVRSLEGAGPRARGVKLTSPASGTQKAGTASAVSFTLANTGAHASPPSGQPPASGSIDAFTEADVYRLAVRTTGTGWSAALSNALATAKAGSSVPVQVLVHRDVRSAPSAKVTLIATSESDPGKTAQVTIRLK